MLSRVENVSIYLIPHLFSSQGHVRIRMGKTMANFNQLRMDRSAFSELVNGVYPEPFRFRISNKVLWLYEGKFYKDNEGLRADEVKALLISRKKLNAQRINRAKTIASVETTPKVRRGAIPDDMKLLVWQRDNGVCTRCGSNVELQFDHIIPISVGGATTPENLQILCGKCNRAKSASVA